MPPGGRWAVALALCLGGWFPFDGAAQSVPAEVGDLVRITTCGAGSASGWLMASSRDSLTVQSRRSTVAIPVHRVVRLEVGQGRSRVKGAMRGAVIGGLVGAGVLAAAGIIEPFGGGSRAGSAGVGALAGLVYGAPAGSLVGAIVGAEAWLEVRPPHPDLGASCGP